MTSEPSPRPWRVETNRFGQYYVVCESGSGDRVRDYIAGPIQNESDAALIVAAVNEIDRLRDLVRRLSRHLANYITSESENDLLREARAAIGEDAK